MKFLILKSDTFNVKMISPKENWLLLKFSVRIPSELKRNLKAFSFQEW